MDQIIPTMDDLGSHRKKFESDRISEQVTQVKRQNLNSNITYPKILIAVSRQGHSGRSGLSSSSATDPFAGNRGRRNDESSSDDSIESKETGRKQRIKGHARGAPNVI